MTHQPETLSIEAQALGAEVQPSPYSDIVEHLRGLVPDINEKQLTRAVDEQLIGVIVDRALAGDFIPKNPDGSLNSESHTTGSPDEIVNHLWLAHAAKVVGNENWESLLPDDDNLRKMVAEVVEDPRLARVYPYALRARSLELSEQKRKHEAEQAQVSPEIAHLTEEVEHLAEEALDASDVRIDGEKPNPDLITIPDWSTYKASAQPVKASTWAPLPEHVRDYDPTVETEQIGFEIGDKFRILVPVYDPITEKKIEGRVTPEELVVKGFKEEDGKQKVVIVNSAGIESTIDADSLVTDNDAQRILERMHGGIIKDPENIMIDSEIMPPELYTNPGEKVYINGEGDALREGTLLGFYKPGDQYYGNLPNEYASVRLASGEVVGVESQKVLKGDQKAFHDRILKRRKV